MLCSCGGSNGPPLIFPRNIAISSFVAGYLFNIAKFLSSGPSSRGELLAYAARELSTVYSCPSSCGNVAVGNEEQSYWFLNTVISFALGFSAGSTLIGVTGATRMALPPQGEVVDEWRTDLLPGDYLGVDYVDDEVSHGRLALWLLSHRSATWVVRSPDGDEWAEELSCVDPNFGPSRAWPFPRSGCVQEEEEGSMQSEHDPRKRASESNGW